MSKVTDRLTVWDENRDSFDDFAAHCHWYRAGKSQNRKLAAALPPPTHPPTITTIFPLLSPLLTPTFPPLPCLFQPPPPPPCPSVVKPLRSAMAMADRVAGAVQRRSAPKGLWWRRQERGWRSSRTTCHGTRRPHTRGHGRSRWQTLGGRRGGSSVRLARAPPPPPLSSRRCAGVAP